MNVFQTYKTKILNSRLSKYTKTITDYNPGIKYHLYDDNDCDMFIRDYYPKIYKYYIRLKKPVEKADLWRYLIIYHYGGHYLDIDCRVTTRFKRLPTNKDLLVVELENPCPLKPIDGFPRCPQYAQYWFAATPKHPAIWEVIKRVIKNIKYHPNKKTLYLTGPVPWTDGIKKYYKTNKNQIKIIKPNYFDVISKAIDTQLIHNHKNIPIIHQGMGTWK